MSLQVRGGEGNVVEVCLAKVGLNSHHITKPVIYHPFNTVVGQPWFPGG